MELSDIFPKDGHIQHIYCDVCGVYLDLTFGQFHENVSGVDITISAQSPAALKIKDKV